MWSQAEAAKALRQVVVGVGLQPDEYAGKILRIGSGTHISAGGAPPEVHSTGELSGF